MLDLEQGDINSTRGGKIAAPEISQLDRIEAQNVEILARMDQAVELLETFGEMAEKLTSGGLGSVLGLFGGGRA